MAGKRYIGRQGPGILFQARRQLKMNLDTMETESSAGAPVDENQPPEHRPETPATSTQCNRKQTALEDVTNQPAQKRITRRRNPEIAASVKDIMASYGPTRTNWRLV